MRKLFTTFLFLTVSMSFGKVWARDWNEASTTLAGYTIDTAGVTVSSTTATLLVNPGTNIAGVRIANNSPYMLYVGTNAANTTLSTVGFVIKASDTFSTGGSYPSGLYGLADTLAGASLNARVLYFRLP